MAELHIRPPLPPHHAVAGPFLRLTGLLFEKSGAFLVCYSCSQSCVFKTRGVLPSDSIKNLPAMQEIRVRSLGQEDPLEEGIVTHISVLAWKIPWTEEPGGLQSMGSQTVGHD